MKVEEIQQAGTKEFKSVPDGTWMMFEQKDRKSVV
jgi:hypothetical protein